MKKTVFLVFLLAGEAAFGFDLSLTKVELETAFRPEYNRNFYYAWNMAVSGLLELNGCFTLSGGTALGKIRGEQDINAFVATGYDIPFFRPYFPLHLQFAYIYNNVFETSTHTLLPTASLQWRYFGFFLGPTLRFTNFNGNYLRESTPAFRAYINFYNTEKATGGISLGNTDIFEARHQGAYSFYLYNRFGISRRISIANEVEVAISGNVGRITSIYGLAVKQGVIFTW